MFTQIGTTVKNKVDTAILNTKDFCRKHEDDINDIKRTVVKQVVVLVAVSVLTQGARAIADSLTDIDEERDYILDLEGDED